jgi:uncharacterized membrane protein
MSTVESSIDVNVDLTTTYNQWTQFESFPQFMENVRSVIQLDDRRLHWVAEIAGKTKEWDAEIVEQIPDQRIAWSSVSGEPNGGVVTFQRLGETLTKVHLRMDYSTEGFLESAGDRLGVVDRQVRGDLERFKRFIESRGEETGAWRGTVAA